MENMIYLILSQDGEFVIDSSSMEACEEPIDNTITQSEIDCFDLFELDMLEQYKEMQ